MKSGILIVLINVMMMALAQDMDHHLWERSADLEDDNSLDLEFQVRLTASAELTFS